MANSPPSPSPSPSPAGGDSQYSPSPSSSSYNSSAGSYFNHLPTYARAFLVIACIVAFLFVFSTIMVCIHRCRRGNSNSSNIFRFRRRRGGGSRSNSAAFQEIRGGKQSTESRGGGTYHGLHSEPNLNEEMLREGREKGVVESRRELADEEDGYGFGYAGARPRGVMMTEAVLRKPQTARLQEQDVGGSRTDAWAGWGRRNGDVDDYYGQHQRQEQR